MIQSNALDLASRQLSEKSSARDNRDTDGLSGFKALLKGKNQRDQEPERNIQEKPEKLEQPEKSEKSEKPEVSEKDMVSDKKTDDKDQTDIPENALEQAVSQAIDSLMTPEPTNGAEEKKDELIPVTLFGETSVQDLKAKNIQNLAVGEEEPALEIGELPQTKSGEEAVGKAAAGLLDNQNGQATDAVIPEEAVVQPELLQSGKVQTDTGKKDNTSKLLKNNGKNAEAKAIDAAAGQTQGQNQKTAVEQSVEPIQDKVSDKVQAAGVQEEEKREENHDLQEFQQVEHHEVKTSSPKEVKKTVVVKAPQPEQLPEKLSDEILKQVRLGKNELDVQLEPNNLGKIHIKVTYDNNQMSVAVICSENKTFKLLSQSAGTLGSIIETNLERPVQIVVDKQEPDYLNNNQEQQHQGQGRQESGQERQERSEDFVQKLRLGLVDVEQLEQGGRAAWQG